MISGDFRVSSDVFVKLSQGQNSVEDIVLIMDACAEHSSPSWVCIPQKAFAIAWDFWNTNSLEWTPVRMGAEMDSLSLLQYAIATTSVI